MGTNGFQKPAQGFENGRIVGTRRLYEDGCLGTDDGRAPFLIAEWSGLQAPGKEAQRASYPFVIDNGRANLVWQSAYLDRDNDLVMDCFIKMSRRHRRDRRRPGGSGGGLQRCGLHAGHSLSDAPARRGEPCMLFAYPTGVQGKVINGAGVNEFVIPNYKQTWADIRKLADRPQAVSHLSFKSKEYTG